MAQFSQIDFKWISTCLLLNTLLPKYYLQAVQGAEGVETGNASFTHPFYLHFREAPRRNDQRVGTEE